MDKHKNETAADVGDIAAVKNVCSDNQNISEVGQCQATSTSNDIETIVCAIRDMILQHVVITKEGATICALWIAFTYVFKSFHHSPRLLITSPQMRCGKTTMLSIIAALSFNPLHASSVTPATIFRMIDKRQPTLLLDEADTYIYKDGDIVGIINQGFTKSGSTVLRCDGKTFEPREFNTFSPMVIGQIGLPSDTIVDRSIPIFMKRKKASEKISLFNIDDAETKLTCDDICRKLQEWGEKSAPSLLVADPNLPQWLNNRLIDKWRPLLSIAEKAGASIVKDAEKAIQEIESQSGYDAETRATMLLVDIKEILRRKCGYAGEIPTKDLLTELNCLDDRPWPTFANGKPLDAMRLSNMLRPYQISPDNIHTSIGRVKGYRVSDFKDTFDRYL